MPQAGARINVQQARGKGGRSMRRRQIGARNLAILLCTACG